MSLCHLATMVRDDLKAYVVSRTDDLQVIDNVQEFALVLCEAAIGATPALQVEDIDKIATLYELHSGSFIDLAHPGHRVQGLRYTVTITMPQGEKFNACCYLLEGAGRKLINTLFEDDVRDWWPDA